MTQRLCNTPQSLLLYLVGWILLLFPSLPPVVSFQPQPPPTIHIGGGSSFRLQQAFSSKEDGWISLTEDGAVQKKILVEGSGELAQSGQTVEIDYIGTLGDMDWNVEGTITCWLTCQQGLDGLADKFREHQVDACKLMDPDFFTEEFCADALGLSNKIQIKKLGMASKRLTKAIVEYPPGTQFDSNADRNDGAPYSFVLGKKKAIRGMELTVASMREGEHAKMKCRADYAYGKEGVRKSNGDVMVPEYATLCFDIKLLKCSNRDS